MSESEKLRIDKYLWAIRAFKTRSISTEACKAGRIKLNGQNLKASHLVKIGEVYTVQKGSDKKIIEVIALLERPNLSRDRGAGRPTKRDRREIDDLQEGWFD
jgi:ribosome-associated heat shock protein Hsp15